MTIDIFKSLNLKNWSSSGLAEACDSYVPYASSVTFLTFVALAGNPV